MGGKRHQSRCVFHFICLSPFLCHCHSPASAVCLTVNLSSTLSASLAVPLSRPFGLSRVGWGQGSEKLIPHNPSLPGQVAALFAARTHLHKHTCIHVYTLVLFLEKWSVFVSLGSSSLSSARGLQWTRSLCLSRSTFTCTHETQLLREIRLRQGIRECNYMCLYWDLFILVSG